MKTILLAIFLAAPAQAGLYYDLQQSASSATMKLNGVNVTDRFTALGVSTAATALVAGGKENAGVAASSVTALAVLVGASTQTVAAASLARDVLIGASTQTLHAENVGVSRIDLSTVTQALSTKAPLINPTFTYGVSAGSFSTTAGTCLNCGGHNTLANETTEKSSFTVQGGGGLGVTYGVQAGSGSFSSGVTAASGTFTMTGSSQYSLATSSGISVGAGGVVATFFSGTYYGDGSKLSGISAAGETNTYTSSKTITGGDATHESLKTSTGIVVVGGGVTAPFFSGTHYGDGSKLSGVTASASIPALNYATATVTSNVSQNSLRFGVCAATATITLSRAARIGVIYNGTVYGDAANCFVKFNTLLDGAIFNPYNDYTQGAVAGQSNNLYQAITYAAKTPVMPAGAHSVCALVPIRHNNTSCTTYLVGDVAMGVLGIWEEN